PDQPGQPRPAGPTQTSRACPAGRIGRTGRTGRPDLSGGSAAPVSRTGQTCRTGRAGARPSARSSTPLRPPHPSPAPRTVSPRLRGPPFPPQEDSATANDVFACSLLYQTRSACQTKVGEGPGGLQADIVGRGPRGRGGGHNPGRLVAIHGDDSGFRL